MNNLRLLLDKKLIKTYFNCILIYVFISCNESPNVPNQPQNLNPFFLSFHQDIDPTTFGYIGDSLVKMEKLIMVDGRYKFPMKIDNTIIYLGLLPDFQNSMLRSIKLYWEGDEKIITQIIGVYETEYGNGEVSFKEKSIINYPNVNGLVVIQNADEEDTEEDKSSKYIVGKRYKQSILWKLESKSINLQKVKFLSFWEDVYEKKKNSFGFFDNKIKLDEKGKPVKRKVNKVTYSLDIDYLSKKYVEELNYEKEKKVKEKQDKKDKEEQFKRNLKNNI